jgi:hypothetical protein
VATSKRVTGTLGPTMIFFSPSLYFTVRTGPSTLLTVWPTAPLVERLFQQYRPISAEVQATACPQLAKTDPASPASAIVVRLEQGCPS